MSYAQRVAAWRAKLPQKSAQYNAALVRATGQPYHPVPPPPPVDHTAQDAAIYQRAQARHAQLERDLATRRQRSETRTAAMPEGGPRKPKPKLSPAEQKARDIAAGKTKDKKTGTTTTDTSKGARHDLGGSGGQGATITRPLGSVTASNPESPFAYFNEPGYTEGRYYKQGAPKGRGEAPTWTEVTQAEATNPDGSVKAGYQSTGGLNAGFGTITTAGTQVAAGEPSQWASVPSRYLAGDGTAILGALYGSDGFLQVQQALKAQHPGRAAITYGSIDDNTKTWFNQVLGEANASGISWQDRLFAGIGAPGGAQVVSTGGSGGGGRGGGGGGGGGGGSGGGSGGGGLLTDPESIMQAADQIAQETIGRRLDAQMKQRMVDEIHMLESNPDPTTTLDLSAEIQRRVREWNQAATTGHDQSGIASIVMGMFGVGGLHQTSPTTQGGAPA